uniref:F-box domain-containing protein n=1 Tax=Arcella intermedia TaxID=1963864 RepID=A0A6B2L8S3_9EUKA
MGHSNVRWLVISNFSQVVHLASPLEGLLLHKLKLSHCNKIKTISSLASLTSLQSLKLVYCPEIRDLSPILPYSSNLTKLDLSGSKRITAASFSNVAAHFTERMEQLVVDFSHRIQLATISMPINRWNLKELGAVCCDIVTPNITILTSSLVKLDLEGCNVTDAILQVISRNCVILGDLSLKECPLINSNSLTIINNITTLQKLSLSKCLKIKECDITLPSLSEFEICSTKITQFKCDSTTLKTLDVSGCTSIHLQPFIQSISSSPLQNLWLKGIPLSKDLLESISLNCSNLRILNLTGVIPLDVDYFAEGIAAVAERCLYLERMYLSSSPGLEATIQQIEDNFPMITITCL